jgi:hypothetical protein
MSGGCGTCVKKPSYIGRTPQINILDRELDGLIQGGGAPIEDALKAPEVPAVKPRYIASNELVKLATSTGEELTLQNTKFRVARNGMGNELFKFRMIQPDRAVEKPKKPAKQDGGGVKYLKFDTPTEMIYTNPLSGASKRILAGEELDQVKGVRNFVLINKKDPLDAGMIPYESEVLIKTKAGYLIASGDTIKTSGSIANATTWVIRHQKGCGPLWRFSNKKIK